MKRCRRLPIRLFATLCLLVSAAGAQAAVCNPTVPAACVNSYSIYGKPGAIELISDLKYSGPVVRLRYTAKLDAVDALLNVRWAEANGNTLLTAENTFGWFNTYVSWSYEWVGMLLPNPSVVLLDGTADFAGSYPVPSGCPGGVCDARYYDWLTAPPGSPPAPPSPSVPVAAPAVADAGGVTRTVGALQSVLPSPTDPGDLDAATFTDLYRFTSEAVADAAGWRYVYSFENLSDVEVDFDAAGLGFEGTAAAGESIVIERLSHRAPGLLRLAPEVRLDAYRAAGGRFDALVPLPAVPEPGAAALFAAGLAGLVWARRRR